MYEPAIKWSGSKRSQAEEILKCFPKQIDTYYEPFCGGCSILRRLLDSDIKVNRYVCSDINADLISLWNKIKSNPTFLAESYEYMWSELNIDNDKKRKKEYFYKVRDRYNTHHKPEDFLFIMRTTTNGMPRYNKNGYFNNSFHVTRNGIQPNKLSKILQEWSNILNDNNVQFIVQDYRKVESLMDDVVYLDPPYFNTNGMYYGSIDYDVFFEWVRSQQGFYLLSFDGISGDKDNTAVVPTDIYTEHKYLLSGNSSFKRIKGSSNKATVYESLYIR